MTNEELVNAPEISAIGKHLSAINREMDKLKKRVGSRKIGLLAEGESGVHLMDNELDSELCDGPIGKRQRSILAGGATIASWPSTSAHWSGGAW